MRQKLASIVLKYLRMMARWQLSKIRPKIIGISGSAGKTSVLNAVYAVLNEKYRVKISDKANSESGVPLNILNITPLDYSLMDWARMMLLAKWRVLTDWRKYDQYVVEMGIDSPLPPKNMEYLLSIVKPQIGIFLNVLPVHTQFFPGGVDQIAEEKGKLIESLPDTGLAILNADDPKVIIYKNKTKAKVMTFGHGKEKNLVIGEWRIAERGTEFTFGCGTEKAKLSLPYMLPEHFGSTVAAALCVAVSEGFDLAKGVELITKNFKLPPSRASVFEGINGSRILDSSYNASPQTMLDMLALVKKVPAKRKLALLGDMRELDGESDSAHERVIEKAMSICDEIHLVGPNMRKNMLSGSIWHKNADEAVDNIRLQNGDLLLVKGSQNTIFLEAAVEQLLADKNDTQKLCRRGEFWEKQRQKV